MTQITEESTSSPRGEISKVRAAGVRSLIGYSTYRETEVASIAGLARFVNRHFGMAPSVRLIRHGGSRSGDSSVRRG